MGKSSIDIDKTFVFSLRLFFVRQTISKNRNSCQFSILIRNNAERLRLVMVYHAKLYSLWQCKWILLHKTVLTNRWMEIDWHSRERCSKNKPIFFFLFKNIYIKKMMKRNERVSERNYILHKRCINFYGHWLYKIEKWVVPQEIQSVFYDGAVWSKCSWRIVQTHTDTA